MSTATNDLLRALETLATQLREQGQTAPVETIQQALEALRRADKAAAERDLLTTTEAARLLGVRSVNTVKRWASAGRLEGYRIGARVFVTRPSVERLLHDGALTRQQAYERDLEEAYNPFEGGLEEAADLLGQTHRGRTPWHARAAAST
jgi:excisionase family DNA binding protein